MQIAAFIGSPRMRGNTDLLVGEVLRGAESASTHSERFYLNKLNIAPCQACETCFKIGRCRVQDDMQPLYDKLLGADVIILGTPIYFWGPSAQMKLFLDRWYALDQKGVREKLAGKRLLLVCAFADTDPVTAAPTVQLVRTGAEWFNMVFLPPLLVTASERGEVASKQEIMEKAYQMGRELA
jgi:putative NADPH-quinone reductase